MSTSNQIGDTERVVKRDPITAIRLLDLAKEPVTEPARLPTPDELQASFPQYEIIQLLGRGGMGIVFKARQKALDRFVAIKLLPAGIGERDDFAARFQREAQALARLSHPNIVAVYDYGNTAEGRPWFAMEYVDGENLSEYMRAGKMDSSQALSIATQLCDALAYAHGEGIVHRDVKPANVMIDARGRVKVADFGLARLIGNASDASAITQTGAVMGTPAYMAPEQRGGMDVDHRADIYSVGVIIYEMLCRDLPHGIFTPPSKRSGCDSRLDEVVTRALQQEPTRRYGSTQELRAAVETIRSSSHSLPPAATNRRHVQIAWGIAALAVLTVAAYFFLAPAKVPEASPEPEPAAPKVDPKKLVETVVSELKANNPSFDPATTGWRGENGELVEFSMSIQGVTDLSPIAKLTTLRHLKLGRPNQTGALPTLAALKGLALDWLECHNSAVTDLSPLAGMPLTWFVCQGAAVTDLEPLRGAPLQALGVNGTNVSSLEPVRGAPIKYLNCGRTPLRDLSPLAGMPLVDLNISQTQVEDLTPLRGMQLTRLIARGSPIQDFAPLRSMPLREVEGDFVAARDFDVLAGIQTLQKINGIPTAEFLRSR